MPEESDRRIVELVGEPREALDVEVKEWLDLSDPAHKATLAKEIIALANHGGGFVIAGFREREDGLFEPLSERPEDLSAWSQDAIQGIVSRYIDPPIQCAVVHQAATTSGVVYPVISVPGGHRVPIVAKRGSPTGGDLIPRRVLVRRPGRNSEEPQSPEEWHQLFDRIVRNRQADLLDMFRVIMSGELPTASTSTEPTRRDELDAFVTHAIERWTASVSVLPADAAPRFLNGYYDLSFAIDGDFENKTLAQLNDIIRLAVRNHSGWPPFVTIYRPPFTPRPIEGAVESWFGMDDDGPAEDPAHSDFWRVSPAGFFSFAEASLKMVVEAGKLLAQPSTSQQLHGDWERRC
ncbi:MAG: hypothetical protein V2I43_02175 [Parvularcula sp.]|jgi:hypothetical protein|nr:hypothetical protein [Parvularcula sp.]